MTKRQTKAEQKRQEEIAAIERELRLMSIGVHAHLQVLFTGVLSCAA